MKKFVMTVTDNGVNILIDGENTGFSAFELVGILDAKKQDILDQMNHPEKYKHTRILNKDDDQISIEEITQE